MSVIKSSRTRNGWKVFEAPGVEPIFLEKDQAINYAHNRASFRSGEIWWPLLKRGEITRGHAVKYLAIGGWFLFEKTLLFLQKFSPAQGKARPQK